MAAKKYAITQRPYELNIVGLRYRFTVPDKFDDIITVFYKDQKGQWLYVSLQATTDPGAYWLKTWMNPKGTAILKPGQYINSHCIGLHRGKYQALVQQNPVTVIRDNNKDNRLDFEGSIQETGLFGINIHRAAGTGISKRVDKHSAGCQVLADASDFNLLMEIARRHKKLYGNKFTYTLLTLDDLAV